MTTTFDPYADATTIFDPEWADQASSLLSEKFAHKLHANERIRIEALYGKECKFLRGLVGTDNKAEVFEFFTRTKSKGDEKDFGLLLDFFDGVLELFFKHARDARLPLDFSSRTFEKLRLWARQEYRNFEAERLAEALLNADEIKNNSKIQ